MGIPSGTGSPHACAGCQPGTFALLLRPSLCCHRGRWQRVSQRLASAVG